MTDPTPATVAAIAVYLGVLLAVLWTGRPSRGSRA